MPTGSIEVEGQKISYMVQGEGKPLLMIGNIAGGGERWLGMVGQQLNKAGYQVIVFDHLGPGNSTIQELARHVGALVDHLGLSSVRIWGYSQGALIAQELALLRPDKIGAAVMMSTAGRLTKYSRVYVDAARFLVRPGEIDAATMAWQMIMLFPPAMLFDDAVIGPMIEMLHAGSAPATAVSKERIARSLWATSRYENRLEALRGVRVPAMVLGFELDICCHPIVCREVADAIPGCQYTEIPGAAHGGMMTHTQAVLDKVIPFFNKH